MFLIVKLLNIFLTYKFYQQYLLSIDYNIEPYRVNELFIIDIGFPLQTRRLKQLTTGTKGNGYHCEFILLCSFSSPKMPKNRKFQTLGESKVIMKMNWRKTIKPWLIITTVFIESQAKHLTLTSGLCLSPPSEERRKKLYGICH